MTFIHIAQPSLLERLIIIVAQGLFFTFYLLLYLCSSYMAHQVVGYLEEAIISYSQYLKEVEEGRIPNIDIPATAHEHWSLPKETRLIELIQAVRNDECHHRDVNHSFARSLLKKR